MIAGLIGLAGVDSVATALVETPTVQGAITPHLAQWEAVKHQVKHTVDVASVGLSSLANEPIVYGYCADEMFYIFVLKAYVYGDPANILGGEGYGYTSKPDRTCWPDGWLVDEGADLGEEWFHAMIYLLNPTDVPATPASTEESIPTAQTSG